MAKRFQYTTNALRYTAKFPVLTYVGIQANFWIIANILLVVILSLQFKYLEQAFGIVLYGRLTLVLLIAIVLGILYGVMLGLAGFYLDRRVFRKMPLGKVIILKSMGSLALLMFLLWLTRIVLSDDFIWNTIYHSSRTVTENSGRYLFYLLVVYYFFMTLVISFINQVNRKFGPGVLVPLLFGRYRTPKEEERIFMFMDLKSSTAIAEKLGHLDYSAFIRDCFMDINEILMPFHAQVYQYVGDEIVVTWQEDEGIKKHFCISFYFACKDQFKSRSEHYLRNYGVIPRFKAGVHGGIVTAVEIGEVKKDIAYHGDTLNTAARIRSICSEYDKDFLISETLLSKMKLGEGIKAEPLGHVQLRGKAFKVGVASLSAE